jgi:hypothetical protein
MLLIHVLFVCIFTSVAYLLKTTEMTSRGQKKYMQRKLSYRRKKE